MLAGRFSFAGIYQRLHPPDLIDIERTVDPLKSGLVHSGFERANVTFRKPDCSLFRSAGFLERGIWRDYYFNC